jgi:cytochrome c
MAKSGATLFASMNCDGCHGGGAPGWVGPSLIDGRWRYGGANEEVFSSIFYGRPKGMPAYGGVLGSDGVWMLVAYLKSQPVPSIVPTTSYEEMDRAPAAPTAQATAPAAAPSAPAGTSTPEQLLTQYGCIACHAVDRKVVGPALKDVAAKYAGHPDVEQALTEKVKNGGAGVWGSIPMAPNPQVPDAELHTLVKWVLALK